MASDINTKTIDTLLTLARLSISPEEKEHLLTDLEKILKYVEQIEGVKNELTTAQFEGINYLREDVITNESGEYREKLLAEMPETKDGYLVVKQIL